MKSLEGLFFNSWTNFHVKVIIPWPFLYLHGVVQTHIYTTSGDSYQIPYHWYFTRNTKALTIIVNLKIIYIDGSDSVGIFAESATWHLQNTEQERWAVKQLHLAVEHEEHAHLIIFSTCKGAGDTSKGMTTRVHICASMSMVHP